MKIVQVVRYVEDGSIRDVGPGTVVLCDDGLLYRFDTHENMVGIWRRLQIGVGKEVLGDLAGTYTETPNRQTAEAMGYKANGKRR